jgi:hypothetical protein
VVWVVVVWGVRGAVLLQLVADALLLLSSADATGASGCTARKRWACTRRQRSHESPSVEWVPSAGLLATGQQSHSLHLSLSPRYQFMCCVMGDVMGMDESGMTGFYIRMNGRRLRPCDYRVT